MPYGFESRSFDNDGSLLVYPRPVDGVPSAQIAFVDGWAMDRQTGCSYVEFVGSSVPSSAQVSKWGKVTRDGALCVTPEVSPASGDYIHQSIRYRRDGAMYVAVNGNANANSDQQTRLGRLTRTGALYLAALSFLVDFTDSGAGVVNTTVSFGGVAPTFTRATNAWTILSDGTIGLVASGSARSYYSPSGVFLGYLAEGASTNLVQRGEDFSAVWSAVGTPTLSAGSTTNGALSLSTVGDDTAAGLEGYTQAITYTGDAVKSVSIYVKKGTSISSVIRLRDTTAGANRLLVAITWSGNAPVVTMTTGTDLTGTPEQHAATGIYRLSFQTTSVTAANTNSLELYPATDAALAVTGTGTIEWGGVQSENATFASSLIRTPGSATVTRNADVLTYPFIAGSATQGTWFVQFMQDRTPGASFLASYINTGTTSESTVIGLADLSPVVAYSNDGSGNDAGPSFTASSSMQKAANAYDATSQIIGLNGATQSRSFDGSWATEITAIGRNGFTSPNREPYNPIRRVAFYALKLSTSQVAQITS